MSINDPKVTRLQLMSIYKRINFPQAIKRGRQLNSNETVDDYKNCLMRTSRLCRTEYNTTAPMYGISMTSGQTVIIVQKFPDLLQQVVYDKCLTNECDVMHGDCVQTYLPYLFLVLPSGPVTLTGQDYILVESGCICQPRISNYQMISKS